MPILIDIMENRVLGREYKRGHQEGRQEGQAALVRQQMEKRFGPIPEWADKRIRASSLAEVEDWGLRLLDAPSLDDLLK